MACALKKKTKPFFADGMNTTKLKLVKTETFPLGVILLCYKSAKN
jgi:hypothetical protein